MQKTEKIIIAGFSKLSNLIYNQLKQSHRYRLRVIDRKQIEDIESSRFTKGQISSGDVLIKAGIKHSEYLIVMTPDEDLNLMTALVASNLNSDIKIFVLINNFILSKRIESMYNNIIPISPQKFISPFIYSLSSKENSIGFFNFEDHMYSVFAKDDTIEVEKNSVVHQDHKKKSFTLLKKIAAYFRYYKVISQDDNLLNYTFVFVFVFILLMSFFVFTDGITDTFVDGFYFAVTMITTIGFGDINFLESSQIAKFIGSIGMIFGAVLMTILNAAIVNVLVKRTLKKSDVLLSIPSKDHTIICGIGNTGKEYISMYKRYEQQDQIVGVDKLDIQDQIKSDSMIPLITGDAENEETLDKLFINNAESLIITTESDITNVNIALLARFKNKDVNIITRINNSSIARYLNTSDSKSRIIDVSHIISEIVMSNIIFPNSVIGVTMEENRYISVLKVPIVYFSSLPNISFAELEEDYQIEPMYSVMGVKKYDRINIKTELVVRTTIEQLLSIKSQVIERIRCRVEFENSKENIAEVEKALADLDLYNVVNNFSSQTVLTYRMSHGVATCLKAFLDMRGVSYELKYLKPKKLFGKLLLCENEVASKKNLLNLLETLGYQVECVEEEHELTESLGSKVYDVLVLNLMLSGIVPVEYIKALREKEGGENLFIIGINDSTSIYENKIFIEAGIDSVLERPFENKELETILDQYLVEKKERDNAQPAHRYNLTEALESLDDDINLFFELFNKFNASYITKIQRVVNFCNDNNLELMVAEIKKLNSSISVFRVPDFHKELDEILALAKDRKFAEVKARIIDFSFTIQDFTVFVQLQFNSKIE